MYLTFGQNICDRALTCKAEITCPYGTRPHEKSLSRPPMCLCIYSRIVSHGFEETKTSGQGILHFVIDNIPNVIGFVFVQSMDRSVWQFNDNGLRVIFLRSWKDACNRGAHGGGGKQRVHMQLDETKGPWSLKDKIPIQ